MIELYTDGASSGNPGPGGYGTILRAVYQGANPEFQGKLLEKEFYGGFRRTTNNRMELLAVIVGLEALKNLNQTVTIFSDSKYVIDAIDKRWVYGWMQKGFQGKKNKDLWLRLMNLYKHHQIKLVWVKGHAGHPLNERCDQLAVKASKDKANWKIDSVFEMEEQKGLDI
ncbi:UNVERIFIED_CONTAM: rnhA [Trichonephila clavipes]|uniref:ribonuclease H n=1 Tax=Sphingobacterium tenebrionis TaxID=3111775 RepID=A0ABU8I7Z4_9SPHI|nr:MULTISPECIES: ribonuclease HI [unclassified Sphingobacterium]QBR11817.1 ribonuclease HI [Sphingobacterium sp. CZ-2]